MFLFHVYTFSHLKLGVSYEKRCKIKKIEYKSKESRDQVIIIKVILKKWKHSQPNQQTTKS